MILPSRIDLERDVYGESLRDFIRGHGKPARITDDDPDVGVRCAWDIIDPGTELGWNWHLDAVCEHLEAVSRGEIPELVINVPPRTLKTSTVSIAWPSWEWASRPSTKYLGGSHDSDLAVDIAVMSRSIIEHPWYQNRWGHVFKMASDQNVKSFYRNDKGGTRRSIGVAGSPTGKGADILLGDDPIDVEKAHNDANLRRALRWWNQLVTRLNDQRTGRKVLVMQRVNEGDVAGWCIENGYTHLMLPNEFDPSRRCITVRTPIPTKDDPDPEPVTWEDPRTQEGELLFAERIGPVQIEKLRKNLGSYGYAGQYNQEPAPDDGTAIFPGDSWPLWESLPRNADGTLRPPTLSVASWDMTFTGRAEKGEPQRQPGEPAYTVGQLWYFYGALSYLIAEARGQWNFSLAKRQMVATHHIWTSGVDHIPFGPTSHVVERKANGEAILAELRGDLPGLVGFNPDPFGDKESRAWAVQPRQEAQQIYLPGKRNHANELVPREPWVEDFIHELRVFPAGKFKDRVDAFSQAHLVSGGRQWGVA